MSYGSDSSLGVESEDDKEVHLSPGRHSSSKDETGKNGITKSNRKEGLRRNREGSMLGAHLQGVEEVPTLESFILLR